MQSGKLLTRYSAREVVVVVAGWQFTDECSQLQREARMLVLFDGKFDFERPASVVRATKKSPSPSGTQLARSE
jgi:hypothetical protein